MKEITLQAIPNQTLSVQLDNVLYDITLKATQGVMSATIVRDNIEIITGARITPGYPLLPYEYQENGNFIMLTADGDYPDYTQFGITQSLIFASQAELEVIRGI